ncbi:MAG: PKD domain-containing protein [Mangrovibacterium sp.]
MKRFQNLFYALAVMLAATACGNDGGETPEVLPVADFTFVVEEGTGKVSFTNSSTNATSYEWEFGDTENSVSSAENPTFTYLASGDYSVTLTAIGENNKLNSKTQTVTVEIIVPKVEINIAIDDNYDEWATIPSRTDATFEKGLLTDIKIAATDKAIYVYMEGDASLFQQRINFFIDLDNNETTGNNAAKGDNEAIGVFDYTMPGGRLGYDVMRQVAGFFVWGWRAEYQSGKGIIGWDWTKDGVGVNWTSKVFGDVVKFEWKIDLTYAGATLVGNEALSISKITDKSIYATEIAEEVKFLVSFRTAVNNWTDNVMDICPSNTGESLVVKVGEYLEAAAE